MFGHDRHCYPDLLQLSRANTSTLKTRITSQLAVSAVVVLFLNLALRAEFKAMLLSECDLKWQRNGVESGAFLGASVQYVKANHLTTTLKNT